MLFTRVLPLPIQNKITPTSSQIAPRSQRLTSQVCAAVLLFVDHLVGILKVKTFFQRRTRVSKKSIITSHILTHHPVDNGEKEEEEISSLNECQQCGATFRKPAHLKQHLQSHSLEDSFSL
ncbi:hypothetical protein V6N13_011134 [Hibiscus sabdariffa]